MSDSGDIFKSEPFTFLVGPERERFVLNSLAVERLSPVLAKMMTNAQMKESIERVATLEETDPHTFSLIAQFAFTENYWTKSLSQLESKRETKSESDQCCVHEYTCSFTDEEHVFNILQTHTKKACRIPSSGEWCMYCGACGDVTTARYSGCREQAQVETSKAVFSIVPHSIKPQRHALKSLDPSGVDDLLKKRYLKIKLPQHQEFVRNLQHAMTTPHGNTVQDPDPSKSPGLSSRKLTEHVKLFVFADKYMISRLKPLVIQKFHHDLRFFDLNTHTIAEVVTAVELTFANTNAPDRKITVNDDPWNEFEAIEVTGAKDTKHKADTEIGGRMLRKLVLAYAVQKMEDLTKFQEFNDLIARDGQFAAEFVLALRGRILDLTWDVGTARTPQ